MRKKLREKAGLTMVELMAATAVLTLLVVMLGTGLQMVMDTYYTMIAQSEVDLLLSTAVDAIADDLRYARDIQRINDNIGLGINNAKLFFNAGTNVEDYEFSYNSDSYGENTYLAVDGNGQIVAKMNGDPTGAGKQVLSPGTYGSGSTVTYKQYEVTELTIELHKPDGSKEITFDIHLKAATTGLRGKKISAETSVTVRCLNPASDTTT